MVGEIGEKTSGSDTSSRGRHVVEVQRIECRCGIHFVPILANDGLPVVRQDIAVKDVVNPITNAFDGISLSRGCGPKN